MHFLKSASFEHIRFADGCDCIFQSLPAPVKRRLKALKKLQLEATKIEAKFYEEIHSLECKYHELYTPIYNKRTQMTKGKRMALKLSLGGATRFQKTHSFFGVDVATSFKFSS
jgi:hypothetical protein